MARSKRKDESSSTPRKHAKTTIKKRNQASQDQEAFGEDPWISMSGRSSAAHGNRGTQSFTAINTSKETAVRFTSPLEFGGQQDASKATPRPAPEAVEESVEDDIAIPTPIHQSWEFKFETRDGRTGYCYRPISGFEHLFKTPDVSQETSDSGGASRASHTASQPHVAQAAVTSQGIGCTENATDPQHSQQDASSIPKPSKPGRADSAASASSRVRKRTRAKAEGLLQTPDLPEKKACLGGNSDEDDDEVTVVMEPSKTFLLGDIDDLKNFFRHRLDELTMKPVRGMVTRWVKQLEPKRKGGYGPYHKMLPTEAPKDATPPWWPQTVLYVEPAHLEKEALLTLAVDIALQHRDTRADELKRQQAWTSKLRQVAEAEVSLADSEQFSSAKNPAFSIAMKERAEKELLPSLFDVMQSYEDFVNQYRIWTYPDLTKAPAGKSITWRPIPRPATQSGRFKRPRPAPQPAPADIVKMEVGNDSGDDTEVDDTMVRLMNKNSFKKWVRTMIQQDAEAARRKAKAETGAMSATPVTVVEGNATTPSMTVNHGSRLATPQSESSEVEDAKPTIGYPFEDLMARFRVQDYNTPVQMTEGHASTPQSVTECMTMPVQFQAPQTISFDQPAHQQDENDVKGGSAMAPAYPSQVHRLSAPYLHSPGQYQTVLSSVREEGVASGRLGQLPEDQHAAQQDNGPGLGALSSAASFTSLEPSSFNSYEPPSFPSYPTHTFNNDFSDITVFNQQYSSRQNQAFFSPPIAAQNIGYGCGPDLLYTSMGSSMANVPSQANQTFNGLPYDFAGGQN